jgi:hypothetical protein
VKEAHKTLVCLLRMKIDQPTLSTKREGDKSSESHSWSNWTGEYRLQFLEKCRSKSVRWRSDRSFLLFDRRSTLSFATGTSSNGIHSLNRFTLSKSKSLSGNARPNSNHNPIPVDDRHQEGGESQMLFCQRFTGLAALFSSGCTTATSLLTSKCAVLRNLLCGFAVWR